VTYSTFAGRAFCAGADMMGGSAADRSLANFLRLWNTVFNAIENLSTPVVAAIGGGAKGVRFMPSLGKSSTCS